MADFDGRLSPTCLEELEDEALDPRIQGELTKIERFNTIKGKINCVELEKLNRASEEINKLELELDDARAGFRQALSDSTHKLDLLAKKLGSCVEKARPYYDARVKAKEVHVETQKAAYMYERACSMHEAAKEMVMLAEQGYMQREDSADPAWQEMLNHATMKVNDAEMERHESEKVHRLTTQRFKEAEDHVQYLQKDLKRAINKSKSSVQRSFMRLSDIVNQYELELLPYFEMKAKFNQMMEDQKKNVNGLEGSVTDTKKTYSDALRKLEEISEEIHRQRLEARNQAELGIRGAGVGSESPSPPPMRGSDPLCIDGTAAHLASSCSIGHSATTVTSSQSTSSHDFNPPSVIYSSPEKARSQSYRNAIETGQSRSRNSDNTAEDYSVNLEDEYMALPGSSSPRSLTDDKTPTGDDAFSGERTPVPRDGVTSYFAHSHSSSTQGNKSDKPAVQASVKGKKLKGLILTPVGAGQDPLQVNLRITTKPGVSIPRQNTEPSRTRSYPYSHNTQAASRASAPVSSVPEETVAPSTASRSEQQPRLATTPSADRPGRRLLKVPSSHDFDEGTISDTESITSGTMLDDDQVEFATMDFSEQRLEEFTEIDLNEDKKDWRRQSLPPKLSHLEGYRRRISDDLHCAIDREDEVLEEVKKSQE